MGAGTAAAGLCLGHQLLAEALGGACALPKPPEIGVYDVTLNQAGLNEPIFSGMARRQKWLQWHLLEVSRPPAEAVVLASSPDCLVQAMRVGAWAWSIQYQV